MIYSKVKSYVQNYSGILQYYKEYYSAILQCNAIQGNTILYNIQYDKSYILYYSVTFHLKLISIFNLLRNCSRRPHLQNKGHMTSKRIRFPQIETKPIMHNRQSILASHQKVNNLRLN